MRIAELVNWAEEAAGQAGWLQPESQRNGPRIAVLGGNLAGVTCAYYLTLAGFDVDVLDQPASPLAELGAVQRNLDWILGQGVHYQGGLDPAQTDAGSLLQSH